MDDFSPWHWLIFFIVVSIVIPAARVLNRVGMSRWWCVISLIPILASLGLWVFAFDPWPKVDGERPAENLPK